MTIKVEELLSKLDALVANTEQLKKSFPQEDPMAQDPAAPQEDPMAQDPAAPQEDPMAQDPAAPQEDPVMGELVQMINSLDKQTLASLAEAIQAKLSEPDPQEMMKSFKSEMEAQKKEIEALKALLNNKPATVEPTVVRKSKVVSDVNIINKSSNERNLEQPPRMMRKSRLQAAVRKDPKIVGSHRGILCMIDDLPDNDMNALKQLYDIAESNGVILPVE
jgi:type I site-specific restriction endonuclease